MLKLILEKRMKMNELYSLLHELAAVCDHHFLDHDSLKFEIRRSNVLKRYREFVATLEKEESNGKSS